MILAPLVLPATGAFGETGGLRRPDPAPASGNPKRKTPNQALQRTAGFGGQFPRAALLHPALSRAVLPAAKPGTARASASRPRPPSHPHGPPSLSLGSLGVITPCL